MDIKTLLRIDEGYRRYFYLDPKGHKTIGIGRNVDANPITIKEAITLSVFAKVPCGTSTSVEDVMRLLDLEKNGICLAAAYYLLDSDIAKFTAQLSNQLDFWGKLTQTRKDVFVNMAFNLGDKGFLGFHDMIDYARLEDWKNTANEIRNSHAYRELPARYERLAHYILVGSYDLS